ncbi:MAG: shikimate kinase [Kocuria sp.]|nr:shikimate kinase [Kocuria sp.]
MNGKFSPKDFARSLAHSVLRNPGGRIAGRGGDLGPVGTPGTAALTQPVVLIGPMAAGKSFLAQHMARFFGYGFVDADQLIVQKHGVIRDIFTQHGEKYFRDLEADAIEEVLADPQYANAIFAVGGGAPMTERVSAVLRDELVAYLEVDAATVLPRITDSTSRPMLQPDPPTRWLELLEARAPRYEELADIRVDGTRRRQIADIAQDLHNEIQRMHGRQHPLPKDIS